MFIWTKSASRWLAEESYLSLRAAGNFGVIWVTIYIYLDLPPSGPSVLGLQVYDIMPNWCSAGGPTYGQALCVLGKYSTN